MPALTFSQALAANDLGINPISDWQFEQIPSAWPRGAVVQLMVRATTINTRITVYSGSQTIQERSPIQGGGTAGTTPSPLNTYPLTFLAAPGDRLKVLLDEVGGAVATVDGVITAEPM